MTPSSQHLRTARIHLGLTAAEVADKTGVSRATISRMENEKFRTDPENIDKLTEFYEDLGVVFGEDSWIKLP